LREKRQRCCVIAGKEPELGANKSPQACWPGDISGRILETYHSRKFCQTGDSFVGETADGPRRNVIKDNWQTSRLGNRTEMRVHPVLGRFVAVRHDRKNGVGAASFRVFGQFDGMGSRVRPRAGNYGYATARDVHCDSNEHMMFCRAQGGRFSRCSTHDECGGAFADLSFAICSKGCTIDVFVIIKWSWHRRRVA
jgi:hypothetical protein